MKRIYLTTFFLLTYFMPAFSQAPNISYQTPKIYTINASISPLAPTNTGGAVPATIYGKVTVFAGSGSVGSANGTGTAASFSNPYNAAIDNNKNLFIADYYNNRIRKITTPGAVVSTFAGNGSSGAADGTGTAASFNRPGGVTTDPSGNVYVGDQDNNLIRKITPAGVVTTFAGNGSLGSTNGPNLSASFSSPAGLVFDRSGNLYVADRNNNIIRKITPAGTVSTFAGNGSIGSVNATGTAASFSNPTGLAVDAADNIYVADQNNNLIRQITPAGLVSTLAGTGTAGATDGIGKAASFNYTAGVIPDGLGNLYVTETAGQLIRKIIVTGYVIDKPLPAGLIFDQTTGIITGTPTAISPATNYTITAYNLAGSSSTIVNISVIGGLPPNISYQTPQSYVINKTISPLTPTNTGGAVPANAYGQVSTFAGNGTQGSTNGATPITSSFNSPTRLAIDKSNNFFIVDRDNAQIRKITAAGVITTFATGFNQPNGITIDQAGNLYVTDAANYFIKKITPAGVVSVFAGNGSRGFANGTGMAASFDYAYAIKADAADNLFVSDTYNSSIRKITPAAVVTTVAGNGTQGFANGTGTAAIFNQTDGLDIDAAGNIYVADIFNNRIRKITSAGVVTTYAGSGVPGSANGPAASATFNNIGGVAVDAIGNVYAAELGANLIRKVDIAGNVTTLAGNGTGALVNGIGTSASFKQPNDVQVNNGELFVTDYGNNVIRKVLLTGYTIDKVLPAGLSFDPTTGIISGTPTMLSAPTNYTVTAYNINGSSSTIVNIQVVNTLALTITANDQTRLYGAANPTLTVKYSGFATGDDATKLTTQPTVVTTATISSNAGTYPITASGAVMPGYTITYVPGTLTVNPIPRTLTFNPIPSKIITDADFDPGATIDTHDLITYTTSDPTIAIIVGGKIHILKPGRVTITATVSSKPNYADVSPLSQQLIIDGTEVRIRPVVTPNGDGINDVLMIDGITGYPDNHLTLVNANGIKIFEADAYDNINNTFNGKSNISNAYQPQGTYFYSLRYKTASGETKKLVGFVVLKYSN